MSRITVFGAVMLAASSLQSTQAQEAPGAAGPAAAFRTVSQLAPVQQANCPGAVESDAEGGAVVYGPGYPRLNAPLYPSPVQSIQPWSGGAIITNQALAPHEMLYPHKYHAMYPPFYYRVKGCWIWTPFGMRQHEQWKLQGTEVKVNYRSTYAPFSGFHPRH